MRWVQRPFLLTRELAGIVVLAHPEIDGGDPITIGPPGSVVWGLLDIPTSLDELTELLSESFNAEPDVVRNDVQELLAQLEKQRMVICLDDDGIATTAEDRAVLEQAATVAAAANVS